MTSTDQELVHRAQSGDVEAFEQLYRKHVPTVYAFLCRCTGNERDAEDLTQDVFVRAWTKLSQFEGRSAFRTWLLSIAIAQLRSRLKSQRRREGRQMEWYLSSNGGPETFRRPGDSHEELMDLERAIATLPTRARLVLVLHEINGYTHLDVARMMGITEGASKAHLHRARRLLRRRLAE